MLRLLLIRHGTTDSTRRAAFPGDEPLDERGLADAEQLADHLKLADACLASPTLRTTQTAAAAGFDSPTDPRWAECNFGSWTGQAFGEVSADYGTAMTAWFADLTAAPHGGESFDQLAVRVRSALDELAGRSETLAVFTHGGPIKIAVAIALGAPLESIWQIDIAPTSITELHEHDGRWSLVRSNWRPVHADTFSVRRGSPGSVDSAATNA